MLLSLSPLILIRHLLRHYFHLLIILPYALLMPPLLCIAADIALTLLHYAFFRYTYTDIAIRHAAFDTLYTYAPLLISSYARSMLIFISRQPPFTPLIFFAAIIDGLLPLYFAAILPLLIRLFFAMLPLLMPYCRCHADCDDAAPYYAAIYAAFHFRHVIFCHYYYFHWLFR